MPEIESSELIDKTPDMSAEQFADVSERALIALLGTDGAARYVDFIHANRGDQPKVSSYLLSAGIANEFDAQAFMAKVNEILESEP